MENQHPQSFPTSWQDARQYQYRQDGSYMIQVVIKAVGRFDAIRLERAMQRICSRIPVFSSRYICENDTPVRWERLTELPPLVSTVSLTPEEAAVLPYDMAGHPPIRVMVCRGPENDGILISVDHVATDAHGVFLFLKLLAKTYAEIRLNPEFVPVVPPQPYDRSYTRMLSGIPKDELAAAIREEEEPIRQFLPWKNPYMDGHDPSSAQLFRRELEPEKFLKIRSFGHLHKVTVQDIILGAYALALRDTGATGNIPMLTVADIRRYFGKAAEDWIGNYSADYWVLIDPGTSVQDAIFSAAGSAHKRRFTHLGVPGASASIPQQDRSYRLLSENTSFRVTDVPFLSNIGVIPDAAGEFGCGITVTDILVFANNLSASTPAVIVGTWKNTLSLLSPGTCKEGVSSSILDAMILHLGELL